MRQETCVISVGNFDGVHAGHRALLTRAREVASDRGGAVLAMAFDPHPATRLRPGTVVPTLTGFDERAELLREAGADRVERLEPTPELLGLSPEGFLDWLGERFEIRAFVEGADFRFGKRRAGDIDTLRRLGESRGFGVEVVPGVATALGDHTVVTASSTIARWLLGHGRVRDAWCVLDRPHRLRGGVVRGERRGRELGYPTANLDTQNLLPADGVYASLATLPDGSAVPGALSVGTKPQFRDQAEERVAEVFLLDVAPEPGKPNLPGLPEYGWPLSLDMVGWVRDQMRFDSVERLIEQMGRDCERVREIVAAVRRAPADANTDPVTP